MKKNKLVAYLLSIALLCSLVIVSPGSYAASLSQIQKQIKEKNEQMQQSKQKSEEAKAEAAEVEKEKDAVVTEKNQLKEELNQIMLEIKEITKKKDQIQADIRTAEDELVQTEAELEEAIQQVEKQDELMQKRTRLMYSNGVVSYLDVLLSATSFADFLDRFDSLQLILQSDREILDSFKELQQVVEEKKAEKETKLAELESLKAEYDQKHKELITKEDEKANMFEQLALKEEELEQLHWEFIEISEEEERNMLKFASEVAKLLAEEKRIKNPYSGGKLGMPIDSGYRVTSNFGMRIHPITGKKKAHNGIDFGAPSGTAVYAAEAGNVITAKHTSGYGNTIIIDHGNGIWTLYAHLKIDGILVNEGDQVKRGDKIGLVGSTGVSTGPHLHFEVRKNEVPVNPSNYLK